MRDAPAGDLDGDLADAAIAAGQEAIDRERNATVEAPDALLFAEALVPPPRLVVVGAVDTAESLCRMARALGWRTAVVDPRGTFATAERVPSADRLVVRWPGAGYDELEVGPADAVVVLTHDPKLDDPAITEAIRRDVGFIGALGSRRTQEKRSARLRESGLTEQRARPRVRPGGSRHRRAHAGGDRRLDPRRGHRQSLGPRRRPSDLRQRRYPRDRREPRGSRPQSGVLR